ncbi:fimbrial protein [Burkholderia ambifaria]|jgi:major type 1 subunit fimbrin (pilin)|uniref:fimbrial protein n=1 Tax=Burkholderia ambifaria TaxID=152480 RepID=UPI000D004F71|nr:fimbrial protein [Burkholderia ambifaria]MBR8335380.1 type 1 fimbrial protein [Burkholderia ambifaria]PRF95770.1 fimbrial protein [Burkholderia ambifaria]
MKKALISALVATASVAAFAPAAHAADGLIEFNGALTAATCKVNGGSSNFAVTLPTVSTSTLATKGSWAGRQAFKLSLTECQPSTGIVSAYLEPGPTVSPDTGNLKVDAGGASNVEIALLNGTYDKINAAAAIGSQNVDKVNISAGKADLQFYAQYESLGGATSGPAKSRVNYTIVYQ